MRRINGLMMVMLFAGLLTLKAASQAPVAVVSSGWSYYGGELEDNGGCYINADVNCPLVLRNSLCSDIACEGEGEDVGCPSDARYYYLHNSHPSTRMISTGEWGNTISQTVRIYRCQTIR